MEQTFYVYRIFVTIVRFYIVLKPCFLSKKNILQSNWLVFLFQRLMLETWSAREDFLGLYCQPCRKYWTGGYLERRLCLESNPQMNDWPARNHGKTFSLWFQVNPYPVYSWMTRHGHFKQ